MANAEPLSVRIIRDHMLRGYSETLSAGESAKFKSGISFVCIKCIGKPLFEVSYNSSEENELNHKMTYIWDSSRCTWDLKQ